ncbi:MAG: AAA family ATPase [Aquisalinus sp.]|nr:AAA family ATPase [Aquisalinus sp.]
MNLVQRATQGLKQGGDAKKASAKSDKSHRNKRASDVKLVADLDFEHMAQQGLYVPTQKPERLPQELRAIKRRLLRRLKYYKNDLSGRKSKRSILGAKSRRRVLMTSTRPAEGKTFTAINLALSLAIEDGINVLLVDTDMPRPRAFKYLNLPSLPGLSDKLLNPDLPLSDIIVKVRNHPLLLLSEGQQRDIARDVFERGDMGRVVQELTTAYPDHLIIFDAPPILAAPEAALLAQHADEVVFVVKANDTPEAAIVAALEEVLEFNENISLVLNQSRVPGKFSHYGSYGEYYSDSKNQDE